MTLDFIPDICRTPFSQISVFPTRFIFTFTHLKKLHFMEFKDIISISGMPGLFSLVSTKNSGIVVKSLEDGKTQFVSSRIHGISSLDNISVYLDNEETTELKKVLLDMQKQQDESPLPDPKADPNQLKEYFKKIVPGYDEEKVHVSDMKKMVKWYHTLKEHNLIPAEEIAAEEEKTEEAAEEEKRDESTDEEKAEETKPAPGETKAPKSSKGKKKE
jgi:hypothetical protein